MIIETEADVTRAALAAMRRGTNPRFNEVMASFVHHMHAFVRETKLTEAEWMTAIETLIRIGQRCSDSHNEAILASDAIGVSTLVCLLNNGQNGATETAAALLGPFWRMNSPRMPDGASIVRSPTPGPALFAACRVIDPERKPIAGATIDVWQASTVGLYENQDPAQADHNLRGQFVSDADGRFSFRSVKPGAYPIPVDGPVGDMLRLQDRHPYRPAHLHFLLHKPGFKTLVTQIFTDDDSYLETDVVFGVTRALVGDFKRHDGAPPAADATQPWYSLTYSFMMEPGDSALPRPPIK